MSQMTELPAHRSLLRQMRYGTTISTMITYLHVESVNPAEATELPPLLLVHGAANAAWVWRPWLPALGALGWQVHALDLRGHGKSSPADLARTGMLDYVEDLEQIAARLSRPPAVIGWSMGGLLAQQYAARHADLPALVLLAPSPPLAVQDAGSEESVAEIPDLFGPEYYGLHSRELAPRVLAGLSPEEQEYVLAHSGQESGQARRERKRGIAIDAAGVHCPVLVVYGEKDRQFPPDVCRASAAYYGAATLPVPEARHWGLVASAAIVAGLAPQVDAWLRASV